MQPKHHLILYTLLSLALIAAVFVSFDYSLKAEKSRSALEDGYTQRVLETQEHLQAIGLKLGKAAVANESRTRMELLSGVSRQADQAVSGLSALPLSHIAMSDTIKFCNQLSEYALSLALSTASGQPLTDEDRARLTELESQCTLLTGQFATAREQMLAQSLSLVAEDNVYYQEAQLAARPLEQVADTDNGMDYPSMIYDGAFSDARHYGTPKALGGQTVTAQQAVELAKAYVGPERVKAAEKSAESGGVLASYGVALTLSDGVVLNAEVTRQGGKLLWMMPEHAAFAQALTLADCQRKASDFLQSRDYGVMEANHFQVYDGLAVINFVAVQDGTLLYPDLVKVQVRMDTGEVVGMEANNYLMNHVIRGDITPALTKAQALSRVSLALSVSDARLCVIPYKDEERLCYEIAGDYGGQAYRVYIDAKTGEELEVLMMLNTADGQLSAAAPQPSRRPIYRSCR